MRSWGAVVAVGGEARACPVAVEARPVTDGGEHPDPLDSAEHVHEWLRAASAWGVPAVVPCVKDGEQRLASGAWRWRDPELYERVTRTGPRGLRVAAMVVACQAVYRNAVLLGAEIDIR